MSEFAYAFGFSSSFGFVGNFEHDWDMGEGFLTGAEMTPRQQHRQGLLQHG